MMKFSIVATTVLMAVATFAAETATPKAPLTPEQKAESQRRFMETTGGFVEKPGTGKVVIVNCQKKFPRALVEQCVEELRESAQVTVELMEGEYKAYTRPEGCEMALYVADDAALPMSLVAVESGWGMVNAAPLGDSEKLFIREFNRAAALTLGAGVSKFTTSIMQPVTKPGDLAKIAGTRIPMDIVGAMRYNLRGHGVCQKQRAIYRQAIAQGWAPAPTNDAQRVIWEQMHAKPTEPMTIKYKKD